MIEAPASPATLRGAGVASRHPLLEVRGLVKSYRLPGGETIRALQGVDLVVDVGTTHAIVGESGSGKSTLARCILRLVEPDAGSVRFDGQDVLALDGRRLRAVRREIQVVFQDPVGSLDPRMSVEDLVAEPMRAHDLGSRAEIAQRTRDLLDRVGISENRFRRRPHELSGGQCQRVAIARALALRPRLVVLDEPTSSLDVSVQAQILGLLAELGSSDGLTYLLISHDLGVVRQLADRVTVLYLGRVLESEPAETIFERPRHPYTRMLLDSVPGIAAVRGRREPPRGEPPSSVTPPSGCPFHPRCPLREALGTPTICETVLPVIDGPSGAACHFAEAKAEAETAPPVAAGTPAVDLASWQEPEHLAWSYTHIDAVLATNRIARAERPRALTDDPDRAEIETVLAALAVPGALAVANRTGQRVEDVLAGTETDGFLVLHDGRIVLERYGRSMTATTPHLLQSVSKSLTGALAGALVAEHRLVVDHTVPTYVPRLRGTSFEGCTVAHLLDMRAGTRFSEEYEDLASDVRVSEQVSGWRPRSMPGLPAGLYDYMAGLESGRPHGGHFEYRSILTDLLGWVIESATGERFADAFAKRIWQPMGAEHDALVTVDATGAAVEDGGLAVTLRDLGRFGQLYLDGGKSGNRQVLPATWVARVQRVNPELRAAFRGPFSYEGISTADLMYHDQWWCLDPAQGIHVALGIHGQMLYVHPPSRTVVAKLSTHADPLDRHRVQLQLSAAKAIASWLSRRQR